MVLFFFYFIFKLFSFIPLILCLPTTQECPPHRLVMFKRAARPSPTRFGPGQPGMIRKPGRA
jgi:hypothetical protein